MEPSQPPRSGNGHQEHWKKKGHWRGNNKPEQHKKTTPPEKDTPQIKCQLCDGTGHGAKDCPSRVNRISAAMGVPQPSNHLCTRVANGTGIQDILLDSGTDVSIVAEEILNKSYKRCGSVGLKPLASQRIQCPATMVPVQIGNHSFTVKAAVMPKKNLGFHLLLGRNIPGINIEDLIAETRAPSKVGTKSAPQPAMAPKNEAQQTPAQTQDSDTVQASSHSYLSSTGGTTGGR